MTAFLGNILGKLLKFVYDIIATIGAEPANFSFYAMSIIATTILFKLLLLPLSFKQASATQKMGELQPKLLEIQNKYKNDPQTQQIKMSQLYKEHNYNPASGCLMLIVQMPIILAFFRVMREPITFAFKDPAVYEAMNKSFFWITNLENPDPKMWGLPLLAAATTYLQSLTMQPPEAAGSNPQMESTQKTMNIFLPIMIFMSARSFPAGLALYWIISNVFGVLQQLLIKAFTKVEVKEGN